MSFSPDGLWLATGVASGRVDLWDPSTGQDVWDRGRHQADVYTVGFGRDARRSSAAARTGLLPLGPATARRSPARDPARLWDDLAGDDGPAAYRAMWALSEIPDRAVALLAEKLRPVKSVVDLDHVDAGTPAEESQRRRRMRAILIQKDPKARVGGRRQASDLAAGLDRHPRRDRDASTAWRNAIPRETSGASPPPRWTGGSEPETSDQDALHRR